jgi:transaldolase
MPEKTLDAVADHGVFDGDTVTGTAQASQATWATLESLGISESQVAEALEQAGVASFEASWTDLLKAVQEQLDSATS